MTTLRLADEDFIFQDTFERALTVPDCNVWNTNKIGSGNGEAKFYLTSNDDVKRFFGEEGFHIKCFVLKQDLKKYLNEIHSEYLNPSLPYRDAEHMSELWQERMNELSSYPEIIEFDMFEQSQIKGGRGYINTKIMDGRKTLVKGVSDGYKLIRTLALPCISYISIMKLTTLQGAPIYYWRLFADFDAIPDKEDAYAFRYGKKKGLQDDEEQELTQEEIEKRDNIRNARKGQGKYREGLLRLCPFCPITMISDERLLIASHIKPWRDCTDEEKVDSVNGFALSPMYDKLFDRGFITFTDDRKVVLSKWLSNDTYRKIGIVDGHRYPMLPLDSNKRREYLEYHRQIVFNH